MRSILVLMAFAVTAWGQNLLRPPTNPPSNVRPSALEGVGIEQKLNGRLPLDLVFRDEAGKAVRLGEFFGAFGGDATISESFMKGWRFSSVVIEKNHD